LKKSKGLISIVSIVCIVISFFFVACNNNWQGGHELRFVQHGRYNGDGGASVLQSSDGVVLSKSKEATNAIFKQDLYHLKAKWAGAGYGQEAINSGLYSSAAAYINDSVDKIVFKLAVQMRDNDVVSFAVKTPAWYDKEETNPVYFVAMIVKSDGKHYAVCGNKFDIMSTKQQLVEDTKNNGTLLEDSPQSVEFEFEKREDGVYKNWSVTINGYKIAQIGALNSDELALKSIVSLDYIWLNVTSVDVKISNMHLIKNDKDIKA